MGTYYNNRKTRVFKVLNKAIALGIEIKKKPFVLESKRAVKFILIVL
jgi:hypothetical protein